MGILFYVWFIYFPYLFSCSLLLYFAIPQTLISKETYCTIVRILSIKVIHPRETIIWDVSDHSDNDPKSVRNWDEVAKQTLTFTCSCVQPFILKKIDAHWGSERFISWVFAKVIWQMVFNKRLCHPFTFRINREASLQLHCNTSNNSHSLKMTLGRNYHSTAALNNDKSWLVVLCVGHCTNEGVGLLRFMHRCTHTHEHKPKRNYTIKCIG